MTRRRIAVVYGSGSSFDSGYDVEVTPPQQGNKPRVAHLISPPCDHNFFSNEVAWDAASRYPSIELFIQKYFQVSFEQPCDLGLEEVWSAVDLNHKHIRLETYRWEGETSLYLRERINRLHEDIDPQDTNPALRHSANNPIGGNEFKFFGDCGRHLRHLIYRIYGKPKLRDGAKDNFAELHKYLINQECDIEYVTFNYDSCLERSLKRSNYDFGYLSDLETPSAGLFRRDFPHILKMHGSLTWKHRWSAVQPIELSQTFQPWDQRGDDLNFLAVKPDYTVVGYLQPAVIPPTWLKQDINDDARAENRLSQLILHQWRSALLAFQLADGIIVVGYSFPLTDFHAQRLFRLAAMLRDDATHLPLLYCTGEEPEKAGTHLSFVPDGKLKVEAVQGFSHLLEGTALEDWITQIRSKPTGARISAIH